MLYWVYDMISTLENYVQQLYGKSKQSPDVLDSILFDTIQISNKWKLHNQGLVIIKGKILLECITYITLVTVK